MANRVNKTEAEKQYAKELQRIKRFIKRAEQRGFRFSEDVIPTKPKKITSRSVQKLKKIKPQQLYKKSTAISELGKIISGTERRIEERKLASRKAVETRRKKLEAVSKIDNKFLKEREEEDRRNKKRLKEDKEYRNLFNEGEIIYKRIMTMIDEIDKQHKRAAEHLNSVLNGEIKTYGKDKVFKSIAQAPQEMIELADVALRYNPGDHRHDNAIREMLILITGAIPTAEELQDLQTAIDEDGYINDDENTDNYEHLMNISAKRTVPNITNGKEIYDYMREVVANETSSTKQYDRINGFLDELVSVFGEEQLYERLNNHKEVIKLLRGVDMNEDAKSAIYNILWSN